MVNDMHPLVALAYTTLTEMLAAGEAKGHGKDSWRNEPKEMHGLKTIRHLTTAMGIDGHPEFFPDLETKIQHAKQALTRCDMYLQCLLDEQKQSESKRNKGSAEDCRPCDSEPR